MTEDAYAVELGRIFETATKWEFVYWLEKQRDDYGRDLLSATPAPDHYWSRLTVPEYSNNKQHSNLLRVKEGVYYFLRNRGARVSNYTGYNRVEAATVQAGAILGYRFIPLDLKISGMKYANIVDVGRWWGTEVFDVRERGGVPIFHHNADIFIKAEYGGRCKICVYELTVSGNTKVMQALAEGDEGTVRLALRECFLPPDVSIFHSRFWDTDVIGMALRFIRDYRKYLEVSKTVLNNRGNIKNEELIKLAFLMDYRETFKVMQMLSYLFSAVYEDIKCGGTHEVREYELVGRLLYPVTCPVGIRRVYPVEELLEREQEILEIARAWKEYRQDKEVYRRAQEKVKSNAHEVLRILRDRIANRTGNKLVLKPEVSIEENRKRVAEAVKAAKPGEVLILCHSAGTGKTTQVLTKVVEEPGWCLLYLTTRTQVEIDKYNSMVEKLRKNGITDMVVISDREDRRSTGNNSVLKFCYIQGGKKHVSVVPRKGRVNAIMNKIREAVTYSGKRYAAFLTLQSLNDVESAGPVNSLSRIIVETIVPGIANRGRRINNGYKLLIMVDEHVGDSSGGYYIKRIVEAIENADRYTRKRLKVSVKDKVLLVVSDANLLCGKVASESFRRLKESSEQAERDAKLTGQGGRNKNAVRFSTLSSICTLDGDSILDTVDGYTDEHLRNFFGMEKVSVYGGPSFPVKGVLEVYAKEMIVGGTSTNS